jgi:uncharacterized protein YraI
MKKSLVICLLIFSAIDLWGEEYIVNNDVLNVRSGPGTNYDVVNVLHRNDVIQVFGIEGYWAKIKNGDSFAYVHTDLIISSKAAPIASQVKKSNGVYEMDNGMVALIAILIIVCGIAIAVNHARRQEWNERYSSLRQKAEDESIDPLTRKLAMQDMNNMLADARAERIIAEQRRENRQGSSDSLTMSHKIGSTTFIHDSNGHSAVAHTFGNTTIVNDNDGNTKTVIKI